MNFIVNWAVILSINAVQKLLQNVSSSGLSSWVIRFLSNNLLFAPRLRYFQDRHHGQSPPRRMKICFIFKADTSGPMYPEILTLVLDPAGARRRATSEMLAGAYKSTDNGRTLNSHPIRTSGAAGKYPGHRPINPNHLYAGTPDGLFTTTDGGGNWYAVNNGLPDCYIQVLAVEPLHTGYSLCRDGRGFIQEQRQRGELGSECLVSSDFGVHP